MRLNNIELLELLKKRGVDKLYHANTVATSITFLEQGGLLSRGMVEEKELYQTPQLSDFKDKEVDVFNDIFLDTTDLHTYFSNRNFYGPVTFVFDTQLLTTDVEVWCTKGNPYYWTNDLTQENKYFQSVEELDKAWDDYQRQQKMITIRNATSPILFDYLVEGIVDDTNERVRADTTYFEEGAKALKTVLGTLRNKFYKRQCINCSCHSSYYKVPHSALKKIFLPKDMIK